MKKLFSLLAVLAIGSAFCACNLQFSRGSDASNSTGDSTISSSLGGSSTGSVGNSNSSANSSVNSSTNSGSNSSNSSSSTQNYLYNAFTATETALFTSNFGFVVPFIANDEYYVEEYTYYYEDTDETETGVNFYAYGVTQAQFNAYKALFTTANGYTYDGSAEDDYGDTWYYYTKNDYLVDLTYYADDDGNYLVDVYVYELTDGSNDSSGGSGSDSGSGGGNSSGSGSGEEASDFTQSEKALFNEYFGFVVPFVESGEYYVEEYTYYYEDSDETEVGLNYYAYDVTQAQFNAYKALFTTANGYTYDGSAEDDYGDTWYYYTKNDYLVDLTYYADDDGNYLVDVYVYELFDGDVSGSGGSGGGSSDSGSGNTSSDVDLMTNEGKGLPSGSGGVYDVDFTDASYVKNVTEQGYYLDGCPTTGSPKVLVIPVEFSDCTASSKGFEISVIKEAFKQGGSNDYFSVYDYYFASSYGKLTLDITVLDSWFRPSKTSSYYETATMDYYGQEVAAGDQMILDEALAYLASTMDLSLFDSDGNTVIDAVVMINTLGINSDKDFYWAYRYWNLYTDDEGYYYEYDGVSANDYLWASYEFLYETYDANGNVSYDDENARNTYTFIHEFAHVLGADDYYDTSYSSEFGPMEGADIMDGMVGDHNAFTKFNYGWLTSSRLVVAESSVTLELEAFHENGDTILIANNWDDALGAYQEYYILAYYTNEGLNGEINGEQNGYFSRDGVVVYHVNASLYAETQDGETYYDIYNNNTDASDEYGTADNLIEYVKSAEDTFTYVAGDTLPQNLTDDNGNALKYTFVVDSLENGVATITFTKK